MIEKGLRKMQTPSVRGLLLHISHYDPTWCKCKDQETPFEIKVAMNVVDAMYKAEMNLLIIDCADGVEYKSHPELKRHYTVPMSHLEKLSAYAKKSGIEVVPKLNFSQSRFFRHNQWFYPYNEIVDGRDIFDTEEYWEPAFELINELIDVCRPPRFFHIGMDEDHDRASGQLKEAIFTLRNVLEKRRLRTVMWRDSRTDPRGLVFNEKHNLIEDSLPDDIIKMIWGYEGTGNSEVILRLASKGFEVWGAPGENPETIRRYRENNCGGLVMTKWVPCVSRYKEAIISMIEAKSALYFK